MSETGSVLPFPPQGQKHPDKKDVRAGKKKKNNLRLYAFGIDLFLIGLTTRLLLFTYTSFFKRFAGGLNTITQFSVTDNINQIYLYVLFTVFWSYFILSYYLGRGQTPGKAALKLRVQSQEGDPYHLSFQEAFMRTLGYFLCYVVGSWPLAMALFRKDGKGIPDFFSQTQVLTESEYQEWLHNREALQDKTEMVAPKQLELNLSAHFEDRNAA